MGSFANTLFTVMLGWFQSVVSTLWSAFSSEKGGSFIKWIGNHWLILAVALCITGLTIDLVVYVLRWRPFRVWKSFFTRGRNESDNHTETDAPMNDGYAEEASGRMGSGYVRKFHNEQPAQYGPYEREAPYEPEFRPGQAAETEAEPSEQDSLARWQSPEPQEEYIPDKGHSRATVTNAGYVVPEDSPYRRPSEPEQAAKDLPEAVPETRREDNEGSIIEMQDRKPVRPKRRKRLRVGDLFSDPEEELQEFEAPQHVIDSRQAYHEPVYPRGWKKSEDSTE